MEVRVSTMHDMADQPRRIASTVIVLLLAALGIVMTPAVSASAGGPSCTGSTELIDDDGSAATVPSIGNQTDNLNCLLGVGNSGSAVAWLQFHLNECNGVSIARDGDFGPQTRTAVEIVQERAQITVDGVYGPQTRLNMLWRDDAGNCAHVP